MSLFSFRSLYIQFILLVHKIESCEKVKMTGFEFDAETKGDMLSPKVKLEPEGVDSSVLDVLEDLETILDYRQTFKFSLKEQIKQAREKCLLL